MSFIKKAMASLGVGSAKLDTMLDSRYVIQGSEVSGYVKIIGGDVDQNIENIHLDICTEYEKESDSNRYMVHEVIQKVKIPLNRSVGVNEKVEIPFSFILSNKTPITKHNSHIWIKSGLDIKMAIDPSDADDIQVAPHPNVDLILKSIQKLGFKLRSVKNEYSHYRRDMSFIQNFEFIPSTKFIGILDEIEVAFFNEDSHVDLLIQIDKKGYGLGGLLADQLDLDENFVSSTLNESDLSKGEDYIANILENIIEKYIK